MIGRWCRDRYGPLVLSPMSVIAWLSMGCLPFHRVEHTIAAERPNIILMMADDLGWGDVGFNGGTTILTPHLDAMARHSLRFTRFYAAAPVCSPTRGSCLTGRHPYRYGIYFANIGHMKPEEWTLAELLQQAGYTTGHFGKWHLGTMTTTLRDANRGGRAGNEQHYSPPQAHGFEVCFSTESKVPTFDPMWKPKHSRNGDAWNAIEDWHQVEPYGTFYWDERGARVTDPLRGDDSKLIMDRALTFIRSAVDNRQPFFAVVWFHAPHLPVVADSAHRNLYPDAPSLRHQNYYACITALDEQVGRLRAQLRALGIAEETLITFCSDNGPEGSARDPGSAGPFRGRKRSLYEGGIRVPALIEWPGHVLAGQSTDFPAVTSDYLPTLVDILQLRFPDDRPLDGISLRPVLHGERPTRQAAIGFQSRDQVAWSTARYKLLRQGNGPWELYDLYEDPAESNNLAAAHPQLVERLRQELQQWVQSCQQSDAGADYGVVGRPQAGVGIGWPVDDGPLPVDQPR
ncbi:MAG: N-acetylgalactosamine-6-sulfatase [Pirellulaceae bacterium]|nr:MAG: N-acetylgalactosamine-6-sulfatase [Pirellulaceae bacterium]